MAPGKHSQRCEPVRILMSRVPATRRSSSVDEAGLPQRRIRLSLIVIACSRKSLVDLLVLAEHFEGHRGARTRMP